MTRTARIVGPGQLYSSLTAAANAASDGDVILVEYSGSPYLDNAKAYARIAKNNILVRGVGGQSVLDLQGANPAGGKGIFDQAGNNLAVENIHFKNAHDASGLAAGGIRWDGGTNYNLGGLTVRNCKFTGCDNGILYGAGTHPLSVNVWIEGTEFDDTGAGDGQSHGTYIGHITGNLVYMNNFSHNCHKGMLLKSRAERNYILNSRLTDDITGEVQASQQIDLPQGGLTLIMGCMLGKSLIAPDSAHAVIKWGYENEANIGWNSSEKSCFVINSTCVAYKPTLTTSPPSFIDVYSDWVSKDVPGPVVVNVQVANNIFITPSGSNSVWNYRSDAGVVYTTNIKDTVNIGLVDMDGFDWHLLASALQAIGQGTLMSPASGLSLTPAVQYVHPCKSGRRVAGWPAALSGIDIGAFEFSA
jgi:hypothetical protein